MTRGIGSTALVVFGIAGIIAGCSSGSDDSASKSTTMTGSPTAPTPSGPTPSAATTATDGATLFSQKCAGCHGQNGGNGRAPKLAGRKLAEADVVSIVTNGKGRRMPAFGNQLSKDQIDSLAKYVSGL